ncbi:hypothetical protein D3C80_1759540 [compost metagenome]
MNPLHIPNIHRYGLAGGLPSPASEAQHRITVTAVFSHPAQIGCSCIEHAIAIQPSHLGQVGRFELLAHLVGVHQCFSLATSMASAKS